MSRQAAASIKDKETFSRRMVVVVVILSVAQNPGIRSPGRQSPSRKWASGPTIMACNNLQTRRIFSRAKRIIIRKAQLIVWAWALIYHYKCAQHQNLPASMMSSKSSCSNRCLVLIIIICLNTTKGHRRISLTRIERLRASHTKDNPFTIV